MGNMLTCKMQLPLAANFVDKESGGRVPGLVHIAVEEHLLLWTSWRYRPRDEDRAWDWWSIFYESLGMEKQPRRSAAGNLVYTFEPATAEQLLAEIKAQGIVEL